MQNNAKQVARREPLVVYSDFASLIEQMPDKSRDLARAYLHAFDHSRPNTAEELSDYLEYLSQGDFNIFSASRSGGTHCAGVHARVIETDNGAVGTIEQIWHGQDTADRSHALACSVGALEWLRAKGCEIFVMERVNPHMLAQSSQIEGRRYDPGEEPEEDTVLEAQLETRSLEQETAVLQALQSAIPLNIARLGIAYFQPDIWNNGFTHGYFGLWIGRCAPSTNSQLRITRAWLDDYITASVQDNLASLFTLRAFNAHYPDPNSTIELLALSSEGDQLDFDIPLRTIREQFLSGQLNRSQFESAVIAQLTDLRRT